MSAGPSGGVPRGPERTVRLTTRDQVAEALRSVVPDADVEALDPDEPVRDVLELDSLDFLSFVEDLAARTGVRIEEDDYPQLQTLSGCVRFVETAASRAGS